MYVRMILPVNIAFVPMSSAWFSKDGSVQVIIYAADETASCSLGTWWWNSSETLPQRDMRVKKATDRGK